MLNPRNIAQGTSMTPGARKILTHLIRRGSISPMEALMVYGTMRLAARIHEIRQAGFAVASDIRTDESGKRYARYTLERTQTATPKRPQPTPYTPPQAVQLPLVFA